MPSTSTSTSPHLTCPDRSAGPPGSTALMANHPLPDAWKMMPSDVCCGGPDSGRCTGDSMTPCGTITDDGIVQICSSFRTVARSGSVWLPPEEKRGGLGAANDVCMSTSCVVDPLSSSPPADEASLQLDRDMSSGSYSGNPSGSTCITLACPVTCCRPSSPVLTADRSRRSFVLGAARTRDTSTRCPFRDSPSLTDVPSAPRSMDASWLCDTPATLTESTLSMTSPRWTRPDRIAGHPLTRPTMWNRPSSCSRAVIPIPPPALSSGRRRCRRVPPGDILSGLDADGPVRLVLVGDVGLVVALDGGARLSSTSMNWFPPRSSPTTTPLPTGPRRAR
mmetsp:Transcript_68546/g.161139  ORF Transcript_68546/g.161139 Transcript_68546/m.161139 type:complete len:335 (-) Transcript_68546:578-1582(-)